MAGASNEFPTGFRDNSWHGSHRNGQYPSKETTPSGFPLTRKTGLTGLLGRGPSEMDTSGIPFHELLGRALAEVEGREYEPPRLSDLKDLLGRENYGLLIQNPKIAAAIRIWADGVSDDSRPKVIKNLAILIADEIGHVELENRIAWEIRRLG